MSGPSRCTPIATAALLVLAAGGAAAQGIDYGALEALFGEPVTVSATGKPQRISEVPATMEIITAEQIRRSGVTDIPALLRTLPGVDVWRPSLSAPEVSLRGYNQGSNRRLLVLLNGRQVYDDFFGNVIWGLIPVQLDEIRQIEVIKGPQSALYGFNATGGVVNIVTYSPLYDTVDNARVRVGTQRYRQLSAVSTVRFADLGGVRLSAGGLNADDRSIDPGTIAGLVRTSPRQRQASADSLFRVGDTGQLGLELAYADSLSRMSAYNTTPERLDIQEGSVKVSYSATTPIGLVSAQAYHNRFSSSLDIVGTREGDFDNNATVVTVQDLFKVGTDDSLRLSGEFRRNEADTFNTGLGTMAYRVFSLGGMWDRALSENLSLVNSLRFDHLLLDHSGPIDPRVPLTNQDFDRTLNGLSFNSALVWRLSPLDTARLTVGRGLQLPSLADFGAFQGFPSVPFGGPLFGNPRLRPTQVTNYELSYDRSLPALSASLRSSVFYQENHDLISFMSAPVRFNRATQQAYVSFENVGDSRTFGVEIGASGRVDPGWTWAANYTFQVIQDDLNRVPGVSLSVPELNYSEGTPRHKVNIQIGYTDGPWELDLAAHYSSSYAMVDFAQPRPFPRRWINDLVMLVPRVGYRLTDDITAEVSAEGLWERRETSMSTLQRLVLFSVVGRW